MGKIQTDLSIKGETIQMLYGNYVGQKLLVNRRYQRKLVWTIEEKRSFIDSILKGFPVPLILLAEIKEESAKKFEIIDGMQRLNSIMSFIEGEFDVNGVYFDLDTMAESKLLKDEGQLIQKEPRQDRATCTRLAGYPIPLSTFPDEGSEEVDEIFRRLNAYGRHLSKQELRQAGTSGQFSNLVRNISARMRGDVSAKDLLLLNAMKNISITNRELPYGIAVEKIFWVAQNIIPKDFVRNSRDEEIVADLIAYMAIPKKLGSSSGLLDELYGFKESDTRFKEIELAIQKITPEVILDNFIAVFEEVRRVLEHSGKTFNSLIFRDSRKQIPRYFQVIYLAFYELLIHENMEITDLNGLVDSLMNCGDDHIKLSEGGGNWSAKEKSTAIESVSGFIKKHFSQRTGSDPARNQWTTKLENLLMQSTTEQSLYDFKQGFHRLDQSGAFDEDSYHKIIQTLVAMANHGPGNVGYVIIGVSENAATARRFKEIYGEDPIRYSTFYVNGVNAESQKFNPNLDRYFANILERVKREPITEAFKDMVVRNSVNIKYFEKSVVIFRVESGSAPTTYDGQYFWRKGPNVEHVAQEQHAILFKRFFGK